MKRSGTSLKRIVKKQIKHLNQANMEYLNASTILILLVSIVTLIKDWKDWGEAGHIRANTTAILLLCIIMYSLFLSWDSGANAIKKQIESDCTYELNTALLKSETLKIKYLIIL